MKTADRKNRYPNREVIVLVHGLGAIRPVMWPIARRLRKRGFHVINYGYWSSFRKIEAHGTKLSSLLVELENDPAVDQIHLVTHSMGCIICRWILSQQPFEKLGRWIMLAPPNRGSHAADFPGRYFAWLIVPLRQLSESANSFVNQLPDFRQLNNVEFSILEAAHDSVIRPASLPLEGQCDYARFDCHHGTMPLNGEVIAYVEKFLGGEENQPSDSA